MADLAADVLGGTGDVKETEVVTCKALEDEVPLALAATP